jgi:hypothetical protein
MPVSIEAGGAWAFVRRHSLRVLERGALEVGGYAGRAERVAAELDLEASTGRAPADHAIGVDTGGAPPVLGDFFEIAGQHRDNFVDIGAFVRSQLGDRRRRSLLEFIQQFRRRASIGSLVTHRWRGESRANSSLFANSLLAANLQGISLDSASPSHFRGRKRMRLQPLTEPIP